MIQIDDAVWGLLIGDVLVGRCRVEIGEFYCDEIPFDYFHRDQFATRSVDASRGSVCTTVEIPVKIVSIYTSREADIVVYEDDGKQIPYIVIEDAASAKILSIFAEG